MAQQLRTMTGHIAGFAARQPRVAIGSAGLGAIVLAELAALLSAHAFL